MSQFKKEAKIISLADWLERRRSTSQMNTDEAPNGEPYMVELDEVGVQPFLAPGVQLVEEWSPEADDNFELSTSYQVFTQFAQLYPKSCEYFARYLDLVGRINDRYCSKALSNAQQDVIRLPNQAQANSDEGGFDQLDNDEFDLSDFSHFDAFLHSPQGEEYYIHAELADEMIADAAEILAIYVTGGKTFGQDKSSHGETKVLDLYDQKVQQILSIIDGHHAAMYRCLCGYFTMV